MKRGTSWSYARCMRLMLDTTDWCCMASARLFIVGSRYKVLGSWWYALDSPTLCWWQVLDSWTWSLTACAWYQMLGWSWWSFAWIYVAEVAAVAFFLAGESNNTLSFGHWALIFSFRAIGGFGGETFKRYWRNLKKFCDVDTACDSWSCMYAWAFDSMHRYKVQ